MVAVADDLPATGLIDDVFSLRHRFGSKLARANVPPKVAQTLMRHGTIPLTMDRYSHAEKGDLRAALAKLPMNPKDISASSSASPLHRADGFSGPSESLVDAKAPISHDPSMDRKSPENQGFDASSRVETLSDLSSGERTRTSDLRVMNPSL